ncbi:unnamed protein product [Linum trigynum]|uniref:Secreted protein n=1 Tax=Linum trigynum TaxID=586398 RepID=A0AAV2G8G2_9ROSI
MSLRYCCFLIASLETGDLGDASLGNGGDCLLCFSNPSLNYVGTSGRRSTGSGRRSTGSEPWGDSCHNAVIEWGTRNSSLSAHPRREVPSEAAAASWEVEAMGGTKMIWWKRKVMTDGR